MCRIFPLSGYAGALDAVYNSGLQTIVWNDVCDGSRDKYRLYRVLILSEDVLT